MYSRPISLNIGGGLDYLIGGSPCTYWSIAQKNNRETEASGLGWELFSQYVRALHESEPKFFIYENNKSMSNAIRESITKEFGFEPICINSALVSAQNRQRLYWVGKRNLNGTYSRVHVEQPEDRGILLRDVLDGAGPVGTTKDGKSYCLTAGYANGSGEQIGNYAAHTLEKGCKSMAAEPVCMRYQRSDEAKKVRKQYEAGEIKHGFHELSELHPRTDGKTNTLRTVLKDNPICEPVGVGYRGRMEDGAWKKRFEAREDEKANALTTAQTDSMVGVPVRVGALPRPNGELSTSQAFRVYAIDGKVNITAGGGGAGGKTGLYAIPTDIVPFVIKKYDDAYKKFGYIPEMYNPYNNSEITEKSPTLTAQCNHQTASSTVMVICHAIPIEFDEMGRPTKAVSGSDGKTYIVYEVRGGQITIKEKRYPIKLEDGFYIIRKLTVGECKRLQTVPDWYEFPVSDTQAYKMLGNGWTCSVISHLINATLENK